MGRRWSRRAPSRHWTGPRRSRSDWVNGSGRSCDRTCLGALVGKAAAHTVTQDRHRQRHLLDFFVRYALIRPADRVGVRATRRDRQYLDRMLEALDADGAAWASIGNGRAGVARLRLALSGD